MNVDSFSATDQFGTDKTSTRMVYGTASLPAAVCVVVELILEVRTTAAL
ncbi:MAG: hypothetical protein WBE91_13655 [Steroidobacteraceae bacterium]